METVDIAILGAGIAGLGAAQKAKDLHRDAVIFEARESAGGLLDNFVVDGFRFDNAVHLSFANEGKVRAIFDQTPYLTHPADSSCYEKDRWLKHPVQNNLFPLEPVEKVQLIESFLERPSNLQEDDYESWLRHQYGNAIAERYPVKYTKKYWATEAKDLSTTWVGNRMRRAELKEILYGAFTSETPNTYYTKEMRYPKEGGYKSFIQPLIDKSEIRLSHRVIAIDMASKAVLFANGRTATYNQLISTLPLPVIVSLCQEVPAEVVAAAKKLKATSIDLVSVGFNKKIVKDLWFYIYDEDILASRAYSPSVKSPANAPKNCSSLQFEIYSSGPTSKYEKELLLQNTVYALKKMQIADDVDIRVIDHKRLEYGNVIFYRGMEKDREIVLNWIADQGISTCGRFGSWDYFWSNQSFLSGYNSL